MSRGTLYVTEWTIHVVMLLLGRSRRFSELRRDLPGISQRMLTLSLRSLERDGLIKRTVTPTVPPRVDYELTPLGHSFGERVSLLGQWAFENKAAVDAARTTFDSRLETVADKV